MTTLAGNDHKPLDRAAFEKALIDSITPLRSAARAWAGSSGEAEDLAQTTLTKAWAARDRYAAGTNFKAWLLTIMRNQNRSDHRRNRPDGDYDPMVAAETLATPAAADAYARLSETRQAMSRLPRGQREALYRVGVLGLSCEEAARRADCAVGSVKSRVSRARAKLGAQGLH
jgi:RNA polymerase sigma-70 factor (ECF subfamily)